MPWGQTWPQPRVHMFNISLYSKKKLTRPQESPGAWPAFNRYLYITRVSDSGPLGSPVPLAVYVRQ